MIEADVVEEKPVRIIPGMSLEGLSEGEFITIGSSDETVTSIDNFRLKTITRIHPLGIRRREIVLDLFEIPEQLSDWKSNEQIYYANSRDRLERELYQTADKYLKELGR